MKTTPKASLWKSLRLGLYIILTGIVFAYGFDVTKVNLAELQSERRQESLTRVIRALARPDIFEYDQTIVVVNTPIFVPCAPDDRVADFISESEPDAPRVVVTPACGGPTETVLVEGFGFAPFTEGSIRFVPDSDPNNPLELGRAGIVTDETGYFSVDFRLPNRESEDFQLIRVTARENVGAPYFTTTAHDTWDKIVETVFMALLATAAGTLLAIPLSFIAARNLMKPVRSPLASIALSLLGWPLGIWLGLQVIHWVAVQSQPFAANGLVVLASVILAPIVFSAIFRWALPQVEDHVPSTGLKLARQAALLVGLLFIFFGLYQLAVLMNILGEAIAASFGPFAFLGTLFFQSGEILRLLIPVLAALAAGAAISSVLSRLGQRMAESLSAGVAKILNILLMTTASTVIFLLGGALLEWLYRWGRPELTVYWPAAIGAGLGLLLALLVKPKDILPHGLVIYYVARLFLNTLRSVEALVMAIVFVIAVGIGPFAGALALGLHTVVSLAKLYSEQVESIMAGPLEAIQATGANRLQTIVYAVIPQIIPPYISYTMYRWDINVRMSTIIGFVGGGGIGFLLQQNINLLNYRAAAAQMFAIAIVVSLMDYISSVLREKYV